MTKKSSINFAGLLLDYVLNTSYNLFYFKKNGYSNLKF